MCSVHSDDDNAKNKKRTFLKHDKSQTQKHSIQSRTDTSSFKNVVLHLITFLSITVLLLLFGLYNYCDKIKDTLLIHVLETPSHKYKNIPSRITITDPNAICVPGAGFSGFWYTIGRLHASSSLYNNALNDNNPLPRFHCYSSGCLSVVAVMANRTIDDVVTLGFDVQDRWRRGDISRFDVLREFVNGLLVQFLKNETALDFPLERVNVVTTSKGRGVMTRQPKSVEDLRDMLIHTTWIPYVTAPSLWEMDKDGHYHMDGALSSHHHPQCANTINVPFDFDMMWNILNTNLSRENVEQFWNDGLSFGRNDNIGY